MNNKSTFNPWHDVSLGSKSPKIINSIIEISKGSNAKYELDKETGMKKLDRFLFSSVHYPGDYGFVPQTLWDDGDPLDIVVLTGNPVYPMTLAEVRPIGLMKMIDNNEKDDKILAVYERDPRFKEFTDLKHIPKHILSEIKHFFETYKQLQGKKVKVLDVSGKEAAYKAIEKGQKLYKQKFKG